MASKNPEKSKQAYKVFRKLVEDGGEWNLSTAAKKWDLSRTTIQRGRDDLKSLDLLEITTGKYGSKDFAVDYTRIPSTQSELLDADEECAVETLERYVKAYVRFNEESTIRDMLRDDFVSIFSAYGKFRGKDNAVIMFVESLDKKELYDRRFMEIAEHVVEE